MCGFAGYLSEGIEANQNIISKMINKIVSRGPDSEGIWLDPENNFALGHKRLSILDLSFAGNQPMISADSRYVLAFNGEIYNHLEIRELLNKEKNAVWNGTSDTETLIRSIETWGLEYTLDLLNGMFAFALWDRNKRVLKLVRDRLGEKPLYYGFINDSFVFGSQLKCFIDFPRWNKKLDKESLSLYFKYGYIPAPKSVFNKIFKLEPGNVLTINKDNIRTPIKNIYWDLRKIINKDKKIYYAKNYQDYLEKVQIKLKNSVERRMLSDVPIGAFLSGGIDSTAVVTYLQLLSKKSIKTFTVGFKDRNYDEAGKAKKLASFLGTEHNEITFDQKDVLDLVYSLGDVWDEPFSDISQIPTLLVSKVAKRQVKVVLSGDGGDELFCGYNRYLRGLDFYKLSKSKFAKTIFKSIENNKDFYSKAFKYKDKEKFEKLLKAINSNSLDEYYENVVEIFNQKDKFIEKIKFVKDFYYPSTSDLENLCDEEKLMYHDLLRYLPEDIMTKVDRASMSLGLEARAPFLDHELVEYAFEIPLRFKKRHGKGKKIIKDLLSNYLPYNLIDNSKEGFSVPIHNWLDGPLNNWTNELIQAEINDKDSLFDRSRLQEIFQNNNREIRLNQKKWTILMFLLWKDTFFKH